MLHLVIGTQNWSSWSMRPWLALKLTGAPFKQTVIPLRQGAITKDAIRRFSPAGKVPVLIDGSRVIHDSLAICEYLAEQFPDAHLWPADVTKRATARSLAAEMHSGFASLRRECPMDIILRTTVELTPEAHQDIERIQTIFSEVEGPFLFGKPSIADCFFAPVISRFVTYSLPTNPATQRYIETMWNWELFQEWRSEANVPLPAK